MDCRLAVAIRELLGPTGLALLRVNSRASSEWRPFLSLPNAKDICLSQ